MAVKDTAIGGASTIVSGIITSAFASADAKKQRQLEEELTKLDLQQQKEIAIHLQDVQGELQKQAIVYKYLAVKNNDDAINKMKSKRYGSYMILGGSVVLLTVVVILLLKKKNEQTN
jgi:hypothetical protein